MIYIDPRKGSGELLHLFPAGDAKLERLDYADFSFLGNGLDGVPYLIGIERKVIRDLLNSMTSGRFAGHQLPGLLNSYHVVHLVVEGIIRPNPATGVLEIRNRTTWKTLELGSRRFMMRDVWCFINTLEIKCGIHCTFTSTDHETVKYVTSLYQWWNRKEYAEHRSHLQPNLGTTVPLAAYSLVQKVAAQLKGVGWDKRSKAISDNFCSVADMVAASESDWKAVDGIGAKLSKSITAELKGGHYEQT